MERNRHIEGAELGESVPLESLEKGWNWSRFADLSIRDLCLRQLFTLGLGRYCHRPITWRVEQ
jgi:hypothetical protein